jgi:uncharacterized protein YbaR (Trm112 family)
MQPQIRISQTVQKLLRCPICHAKLKQAGQQFECINSECNTRFPIVDGTPVLINEQSSIFAIDDFVSSRNACSNNLRENKRNKTIRRLIPTISKNIKGSENYSRLSDLLLRQSRNPRILVIGGAILGSGMGSLTKNPSFDLVESDVAFGPRTMLISDGHDIPFDDGSFDGVIPTGASKKSIEF